MPAAASPLSAGVPEWFNSRLVIGVGVALSVGILALGIGFLEFERTKLEDAQSAQIEQYARLLEYQTSSQIASGESVVRAVSGSIEGATGAGDSAQLGRLLEDSVRGRAQLRSLSLLDTSGQVLESSTPGDVGKRVDLPVLGRLSDIGPRATLGKVLAGRDLPDLTARGPAASKLNALPLLWRLKTATGKPMVLVALFNADHFASQYELTLNDPSLRVALADYSGELLVASSNVALELGSVLRKLPAFSAFLPGREKGRYIGTGMDDPHVITAFRTSRQWPLVLVVERSYSEVWRELGGLATWTAGALALAWLVIGSLCFAALRSLRRHNAVSARLQMADQAVFASEARNMAVLESSLDGVLTIDAAGRVVAFNPAAERMFGRDSTAVIGQPMHVLLMPPHLRQAHQDGMARYLQTGHGPVLNRRIEIVAMHSDESVFPIELTIVPIHVGLDLFFTATVRDISERKKIEAEKATLLSQYRVVATDLERQKLALDEHAIVSIADADERIVYANDKLVGISGYAREELIGKAHYLFRRDVPDPVYGELRASLAAGKVWHGELVKRRRDGGTYWVSNTTVPVPGEDGRIRHYITIETDVSELRRTEFALKEARRRELDIGSRIQQTLLAATPAQLKARLWLSSYSEASRGVDGDFVDVIPLGPHIVDVIAGDVMGKGVPAALMGAATKLQFSRSIAELLAAADSAGEPPQPAAIVASVHRAMTGHLQALEAFVTLTYLRIECARNTITWVGCGHEEPLVIRGDGATISLPNQHPPMGVVDGDVIVQAALPLAPGDAVFLCSDGLTDAVRPDGERIGRERLNAVVRRVLRAHPSPAAALHTVRRKLLHPGVQLNDDVTMVLVMRPEAGNTTSRRELPISLGSLRAVRDFVRTQALDAGLPEEVAGLFEVAGVEVFTNIVRHAKGLLPGAPVELMAHCGPQELVLEFFYLGEAFIPPAEVVEADFAAFPEGGFGLTIIRSASDALVYDHHDGVNSVRMTRRLLG